LVRLELVVFRKIGSGLQRALEAGAERSPDMVTEVTNSTVGLTRDA
jgi:hypothetical protein